MHIKTPTLSICIPTYNRSKFLSEALDSIIISLKGFEDKVEIIISDNASTDNTIDIIKGYHSKHNFIRYNRNKENVIDKNFFITASLARGKYIWIFADDDKMEEKAVRNVFNYINQNYNLIICNYSIWDNNFSSILKEKFYRTSKDIYLNDHNKILKELGSTLQFISSIIIEKETFFILDEEEYNSLHEYGISFVFSLYTGIINNANAVLISKPQLQYRGNNSPLTDKKTWYKYFSVGPSILFDELQKKKYSSKSISSAKNITLKKYILHDISFRKRNENNIEGIFAFVYPYYKRQFIFWLAVVPMLYAPKFILVFVNKILLFFRKLFHK